ncbi:MAG: hypothetical protein GF353_25910 [Candidatus Lokiarchaeota archaeon]|nr:hypothetical protein [Candidatus Lokiarchaeota archaeon]
MRVIMSIKEIDEFEPIKELIHKSRVLVRKILDNHFDKIPHDKARREIEMRFFFNKVKFITKKWTLEIIWELEIHEGLHFNEIMRHLTGKRKKISTRSLSDILKKLQKFGLVSRSIQDTRPPTVFYQLTDKGKGFVELSIPLIMHLIEL